MDHDLGHALRTGTRKARGTRIGIFGSAAVNIEVMSKATKQRPSPISLRFDEEELERIDRTVKRLGISRHAYLKRAALKRLNHIDPAIFAIALSALAKIKASHARAGPEDCEAVDQEYQLLRDIFTQALGRK